jgi:hypothetical protein
VLSQGPNAEGLLSNFVYFGKQLDKNFQRSSNNPEESFGRPMHDIDWI